MRGFRRCPHHASRTRVHDALGDHPHAGRVHRQCRSIERHDNPDRCAAPPRKAAPAALALFANRRAGKLSIRWLIGLAALATGCGDPIEADNGAPEPVTAADTVSVSGRITFDQVPVMSAMGGGLDYGATVARSARGVTVELLAADRSAGTAIADDEGRYRLDAPRESDVSLRVRAEFRGEDANPLARVLDNTRDGAMHTMNGAPFRTGETDLVRDLHAASGWTGTGYGEPRAAAAFAILDVVYEAMQWVRAVDAEVAFVPLDLFWSPDNRGIVGQDGEPDYASGRIGGTHYRRAGPDEPRSPAIYLVGAQNEDTDEYDRSIVAHEWMHYLLDTRSRDDSIGGRHALGEQLDLRVAFSEGAATALAAAILGETETRYTLGPQQAHGGGWSVERFVPPRPGWFSEGSVMAIVYDLLDPANDDPLAFGFAEVYDVLVNEMRATPALTSVFAFVDALKRRHPPRAGEIDALLAGHRIGPVVDAFGSTESNAGYPPGEDTLPVYAKVTVNAAAA